MATYNISTLAELQLMTSHLSDDCVLLNDIDASATASWNARTGHPGEYYGFLPIASFAGTFDGGGFTISNLYINRNQAENPSGYQYIGLFGSTSLAASGFIKNFTLKNINYTSKGMTGGLVAAIVGADTTSLVDNCRVTGILSITNNYAGGLIGTSVNNDTVSKLTVQDCSSSVSISAYNFSGAATVYMGVGGFIGSAKALDILRCVAGGTITLLGTQSYASAGGFCGFLGGAYYGGKAIFTDCKSSTLIVENATVTNTLALSGFVGTHNGTASAGATCTTCMATGNIIANSAAGTFTIGGFAATIYNSTCDQCAASGSISAKNVPVLIAGGFLGRLGTVTSSYARGDVCKSGCADADAKLGGFVGSCEGYNYTDCYSVGYVYPTTKAGGFIGYRTGGTITTCYWDTTTSGTATAVGDGVATGITGYATAAMKLEATYTGFDFNAIWTIPTYYQPATSQANLTVWPSATGDYEDFDAGVKDADSFVVVIPSTNEIRWIESLESLLIGTAADEWKIGSNKLDTPLSPTNFGVKQQSNYGGRNIQAVKINEVVLFTDFVGRKIREMTWGAEQEKYVSPDMTSLAEHITESGVVCVAHQRNPDSILWCVLADGSLISMVYDREQNVIAWADHPIDGLVQSVCVVPGTSEDAIYISVKRTINSVDKVYLEKLGTRIQGTIANSFFVDSGIINTGTSTTIAGLTHLELETVVALVDGVYDGTFVVSGGAITLNTTPVAKTIVGLPFTPILQPMRIVQNSPLGSSMGSNTRIHDLKVVFLNTKGAQYGSSESDLYSFDFTEERVEDAAYVTGLFSGDISVNMPGGFSNENPIIISSNRPYPMTVKAIIAGFEQTGK